MNLSIIFVGRAELLAEEYEGIGATSFLVQPLVAGHPATLVLPQLGDRVTLRMHPGPDARSFQCVGRHFDFSQRTPVLQIELDMPAASG